MKEKLEDLKALLKNDKRWRAAGIFIIAVIVIWVLTDTGGGRRRFAQGPNEKVSKQGMGAEEQYQDLVESFKQQIDQTKTEQAEMKAIVQRNSSEFKEHREQVSGIFENLVDKFEGLSREVDALASAVKQQSEAPPTYDRPSVEGPDTIDSFGNDDPILTPPPKPPAPTLVSVISPGDSVEVELLTGVNAPVDGTPYPVVFKLNGPITGPDGSSLQLGEARLIAAAQGSEVDSRALFRLSSLAIRHPSGRRSTVKIDGWIVGEDGIRGMSGRLIDKLGRLILATAGVSFAAALGNQLGNGNAVTVNNNAAGFQNLDTNSFDIATASALTDASNRLGQVLLRRYESFVPVVEVLSARDAVAIFSQPTEISVIEGESDFGGAVFAADFEE
jgi:hypothetical protein